MARKKRSPQAEADPRTLKARAIPRELRLTSELYIRAMQHNFHAHGIRFNLYMYLRILWSEDGISQTTLSERVGRAGANTVAVLNSLQRKGFVKRVPSGSDKRTMLIFLTAQGKALEDVVVRDTYPITDSALEGVKEEDIDSMREVLRRMQSNLLRKTN